MTDEADADPVGLGTYQVLRARARLEHGGNTQALLVVYAIESFLRRLAISPYADRMLLKGGMLLAAHHVRRVTRDADLAVHAVRNHEDTLRDLVAAIAALVPSPRDGVEIDPSSIRTEVMREDAEYHGIRCKVVAHLARAVVPFTLDFSFGDATRSTTIELESVVDRPAIMLHAYPLSLNLAEKIVTAMQRRDTNTRDRDFADLWVTSRLHAVDGAELGSDVAQIASVRKQQIISLGQALADIPDRQRTYTAMVERMSYLRPPPDNWGELIADVVAFVDPLLASGAPERPRWDPTSRRWGQKGTARSHSS